jgi:hypothetical protein
MKYITLALIMIVSVSALSAEPLPVATSGSMTVSQTYSVDKEADALAGRYQAVLNKFNFELCPAPEDNVFTLPKQKTTGTRTVSWYSCPTSPELKVAITLDHGVSSEAYFSIFVNPSKPESLSTMWKSSAAVYKAAANQPH